MITIAVIEIHETIIAAITAMGLAIIHLYKRSADCDKKHEAAKEQITKLKIALKTCPMDEQCGYYNANLDDAKLTPNSLHAQRFTQSPQS
jgi:hypothetical protein